MSDTNKVELYMMPESTWGTTPASALEAIRFAGEGLGQATSSTQSNEINSNRDISSIVRTEVNADGDINGEIAYGTLHTPLTAAMMGDWTAPVSTAANLAAVASGNKYTRAAGSFVSDGWVVGMWGLASTFTTPGNNGLFQVTSVSALELAVTGLTLADEGSASRALKNSGMIRNGATLKSFTIEKKFTDIASMFHVFRGMCCNTFGISVQVGSIATWTSAWMGKKAEELGATVGTGGPTAANTNDVMNAIDNVTGIREGGALFDMNVTAFSANVNNNLRAQRAWGSPQAFGIGMGRFMLEGSLTAYFEDSTLFQKYLDFTSSSFSFAMVDTPGNYYIWTVPALRFTSGKVVAGGPDADVMIECGYQAERDPVTDCMFQVDRIIHL